MRMRHLHVRRWTCTPYVDLLLSSDNQNVHRHEWVDASGEVLAGQHNGATFGI